MDIESRLDKLEADMRTMAEVTRGLIQVIGAVGLTLNHRIDTTEASITIEGGHHDMDVTILHDAQHYLAENLEAMGARLNDVEAALHGGRGGY